MKRHLALFAAVVIAACGSAHAQDGDPNAELEAWRAALADYNRRADDAQQQYNEALALWRANFDEATRPMSPGARFLAGLQYVGDKALTGVVNYYSTRAALRTELGGQLDRRFDALRNDVMGARADILAANSTSTASIIAANSTSTASIIAANNTSAASIIAANNTSAASIIAANQTSTGTIMGALNTSGQVLGQLGMNLNAAITANRTAITANGTAIANNGTAIMNNGTTISGNEEILREVLRNLQRNCDTPFGQIGQPCSP